MNPSLAHRTQWTVLLCVKIFMPFNKIATLLLYSANIIGFVVVDYKLFARK